MLWWLFIPAAYLAVAVEMTCADQLAWQGSSVGFVVLLWSVVAIRSHSPKAVLQAGILGLLRDLSLGMPLGVSSAVLMVIVWMVGLMKLPSQRTHRSWLLWGLPLIVTALAALHVADSYQAGMRVSPVSIVSITLRESAVTTVAGLFLGLLMVASRRLVLPRSISTHTEFDTHSLFLSR
ncbi:MAG: hypothetical protein P8M30_05835 [Planctomycetaceae bacterium]|jgi:hypothetical protein|nr:hypothetical protein [Planctomycetaceae bacterium]MDG2388824.1 hypothetical protein [Planctomycetaceae bacterium]